METNTIQIRLAYRECLNKWGQYLVKTLRIHSKGYISMTFKDPDGLCVADCIDEYIRTMEYPKAHIEIIHDARVERRGGYEIHYPDEIIGSFDCMGKISLFDEPDEDGIPVDLSGTLLGDICL